MLMIKVMLKNGEEVELPQEIFEAFKNSSNKMLAAIFRAPKDEKLSLRELRATPFDLKLIETIIKQNGWSKDIQGQNGLQEGKGEFAILDENGIVYKSNGSNFELEMDSNGYMHINGEELVVHSHKDGYIEGKTKESVDSRYRHCLEMFYTRDKSFGENGFTSTNGQPQKTTEDDGER